MEDVKTNVSEAEEATVETETTEQAPQPEEKTSAPDLEVAERTVPYSRFSEVNTKYKEMQRKLAEVEGSRQLEQYDPNDLENVFAHPFVQELLIKQAKQELTDYARQTLDEYPNLHPAVKKAILSNARGFVNETTSDVETAKLDLLEYIEGIAEEASETQQTPSPKTFPIATTNVSTTDTPGVKPAEIAKIIAKPVDTWTDEEADAVDSYKKSIK